MCLSINRADSLPHKSARKKVSVAFPPHIHFTSPAMSAPKKHERENDFDVQMQERKQRFIAIDANIEQQHALAGNLLDEREKMPPVDYAAPAGEQEARMQRFRSMEADIGNAIAATDNLLQERNTMVIAENTAAGGAGAGAGGAAAGGAAGKMIAKIDLTQSDSDDLTQSDSDAEVVEISDDDDDDDVQIIGESAVP